MAETIRLNKVLRELNISIDRAVDFLESKKVSIEKSPNTKISQDVYELLSDEFQTDASKKEKAQEVSEAKMKEKEELRILREKELEEKAKSEKSEKEVIKARAQVSGPKQVGKIDLEPKKEEPKQPVEEPKQEEKPEVKVVEEAVKKEIEQPIEVKKTEILEPEKKLQDKVKEPEVQAEPEPETLTTKYQKLSGPKTTGEKID